MKSKTYHIDLTPRKTYLLGYVVGYIYPSDGLEWLCCSKDGHCCSSDPHSPKYHALIHKTEAKAKAVAENLAQTADWQVFYRPYLYESSIPKHAKGLQLWTGKMQKFFVRSPKAIDIPLKP